MTEQVIFKIDGKLKAKAMKKAKKDGITFSSVLQNATKAYVRDDFEVGFVYSPKLIRDVRQAEKEIKEGKGLRGDLRTLLRRV
ncbi:MAG: hypothetical protein AAB660_02425 [Patescibacteria group bacterium]